MDPKRAMCDQREARVHYISDQPKVHQIKFSGDPWLGSSVCCRGAALHKLVYYCCAGDSRICTCVGCEYPGESTPMLIFLVAEVGDTFLGTESDILPSQSFRFARFLELFA